MTFDQLQYFITIVKTGSMTKAAEELNVVQPALSRAIQRLEDELNVKLFDRKGRAIILNQNGAAFLQFAEQCINSFHQTKDTIHSSDDIHGSLKIGNMVTNQWVVKAVAAFSRLYPNVKIEYVSMPNTSDAFDFHFFIGPASFEHSYLHGTLESVELWKEPMILLVSKNHPLADRVRVKLSEVRDYPFVFPCGTEFSKFAKDYFRLANMEAKNTVKTNDPSMLYEIIKTTHSVAIAPKYQYLYEIDDHFRTISIVSPEYVRQVYMYWPSKLTLNTVEKLFYEFMMDYFKNIGIE